MIIKTFTAESAAAALKKVRAELGKDAVVLKTRELPFGRGVERMEITACVDKPMVAEAPAAPAATKQAGSRQVVRATFPTMNTNAKTEAAPAVPQQAEAPSNLMGQTVERLTSLEKKLDLLLSNGLFCAATDEVQQVREQLTGADLPAAFVNEIITAVSSQKASDVHAAVRTRLTDALSSIMLTGLSFKPGDRIAFMGYAGAGKTSVLGKLAAKLVYHEKQKVTLVTLDTVKIGAFEELSSYADILGSNAMDFQTASTQSDSTAITLIDTPALSKQKEQLQQIRVQLETLNPNYRIAVVSAMTRSVDAEKIAEQLNVFQPTHVVFTMLDLTDRWGSLVAACKTAQIPVAFVTNAPAGMGTVNVPDPANFTRALLATEESRG